LLIAADGRKEEAAKLCGWLARADHGWKRLLVVEEEQKKKIAGCCSLLDWREKN
jgi:hypothetical protein